MFHLLRTAPGTTNIPPPGTESDETTNVPSPDETPSVPSPENETQNRSLGDNTPGGDITSVKAHLPT